MEPLTDEQLREWRRLGHPGTGESMAIIIALRSDRAKLEEALKDCRMRCGELDASNARMREALPALWGQYDDEGRKLWIDAASSARSAP